ncbi:MAG: hypothetical protein R2693_07725 [Nocardioidaceae bacterium]
MLKRADRTLKEVDVTLGAVDQLGNVDETLDIVKAFGTVCSAP